MTEFYEPPINPDDDTNPSMPIRPIPENTLIDPDPPDWKTAFGWLSLFGAALFTIATLAVIFIPQNKKTAVHDPVEPTMISAVASEVPATPIPATAIITAQVTEPDERAEIPVVNPEQLRGLLETPLEAHDQTLVTYIYEPFTIISGDRPRSEFIKYTAVQGDTINAVAERYNLAAESLAWCNNRRIVQVLRPNDILDIPPVDGACHRVLGTREETLGQIATKYQIDNAYLIIDSVYNYPRLVGIEPDDILPGGTDIFIPGGQGEPITWSTGKQVETNADGSIRTVTFAPGQPGSCGAVQPSGGTYWTNPLPNGSWVRGFYAGHTGIDIAASTGTPIHAANGGRVVYAGWNNWGYGNTVLLEHGGVTSTLYGHMNSISVGCGQFVNAGDVIGTVGNTGNSSGPHLHFEIRSGDSPINPSGTPGVGW